MEYFLETVGVSPDRQDANEEKVSINFENISWL